VQALPIRRLPTLGRCIGVVALLGASFTVLVAVPQGNATSPVDASTPSSVQAKALGRPTRGRLLNGVQFPEFGDGFLTWDSGLLRVGNSGWRRWTTNEVARRTLCVLSEYAKAHPGAARILVGDFALPTGGSFGREYGGPGHSSHQNGLDVDIYYPRVDGAETVVATRFEANFVASQELVDRFVAAGAYRVFVGRRTPLRGPAPTVQRLVRHENHLHVRFANPDQPPPTVPPTVTTLPQLPSVLVSTTTMVPPVVYPTCNLPQPPA
jgi:hypothetical protein